MAPAEAQVAPNAERRRSDRWPLALPLIVRGMSLDARAFQEETFTLSISAHGALVALSTTVTLGQTLFLRNPQTQDETGAWVTRFGLPRGGFAQVGVEFVRPDADFWSNKPSAKPRAEVAESPTEGIYVLPPPEERGASETFASDGGSAILPQVQTAPSETIASEPSASTDVLMHALEKTLRQAAEEAVVAAATLRLGAAVNQAAAAIENFSQARVRQLEERLLQYRNELATSAREDFLLRVQADVAVTEEHMRKRANEIIEDGARNAHGDLAKRMQETTDQVAVQFSESANASSNQFSVRLAGQVHAAASGAQAQLEGIAAGFNESERKARDEMERAVDATRQRMESLTAQMNHAYTDWEARLRALQQELAVSKEQEIEQFRERLRNILTTVLASLG